MVLLLCLIFFPESPDQNLEVTILFSIVEISNNYVFEDDIIPHKEALQVMNFDHCLHIVLVIGKYTDVFRGIFLVVVWGIRLRRRKGKIFSKEKIFIGEENFFVGGLDFPTLFKTVRN